MIILFKAEIVNKIQIESFKNTKEYFILEVISVKCLLATLSVLILKFSPTFTSNAIWQFIF